MVSVPGSTKRNNGQAITVAAAVATLGFGMLAALLGKERALFVPTGTMGNAPPVTAHAPRAIRAAPGCHPPLLVNLHDVLVAKHIGLVNLLALETAVAPEPRELHRVRQFTMNQPRQIGDG